MTDGELIEAAALAAGLKIGCLAGRVVRYESDFPVYWNPLIDDGDAMRLAVQLSIRVEPSVTGCTVMWTTANGMRVESVLNSVIGADSKTATRRAIVRAAAEIGKTHNV